MCRIPFTKNHIQPTGIISIHEMSSILLDKLDEMDDSGVELYLADMDCKVYRKSDVIKYLSLDPVSEITFKAGSHDCDDFAAKLFGKFAGLIWTNTHALNWFIDTNKVLWFIEPQSDKIAQNLEDWQGWHIRFFISR